MRGTAPNTGGRCIPSAKIPGSLATPVRAPSSSNSGGPLSNAISSFRGPRLRTIRHCETPGRHGQWPAPKTCLPVAGSSPSSKTAAAASVARAFSMAKRCTSTTSSPSPSVEQTPMRIWSYSTRHAISNTTDVCGSRCPVGPKSLRPLENACGLLEPGARQLARPVLRGLEGREVFRLPDNLVDLDFADLTALRVHYLAHLPCETASGVISPWLPGSLSGASGILPRLPGMPVRRPTAPEDWHLPDSHRITWTPVRARFADG